MKSYGFDISFDFINMDYIYGRHTFGPTVERRKLDDIRKSLLDPNSDGPDVVYAIAMDVGDKRDQQDLIARNLLYGTVIYAKGRIGSEPVRSQGHVHAVSESCGASTPEVYEIWHGTAVVYMQEHATDDPGRCFAVTGHPGDIIIVPPGWAHATISADPSNPLVFGAWCVRDYGFEYEDVRRHNGLAYYPILDQDRLHWIHNPAYERHDLIVKSPRRYDEFDLDHDDPIYTQYQKDRNKFEFVTNPERFASLWKNFTP